MSYILNMPPRRQISEFIIFALSRPGLTIPQIEAEAGRNIQGRQKQHAYRDRQAWHRRNDIIEYVARQMRIHPSMWGPERKSLEFQNAADQELAKLKKKGIVLAWHKSGNMALFRIDDEHRTSVRPETSVKPAPPQDDPGKYDMKKTFLSIITQSSKANTYKFALGRALLEYCRDTNHGEAYNIPYTYFAKKFLEYYWYQECRYRIKQDFSTKSNPRAIMAIREVFDTRATNDFQQIDVDKKAKAEKLILRGVFGHARSGNSLVIPKFQKIRVGKYSAENRIFYDYSDDKKMLYMKPEAFSYLKENYGLLSKALLAEWAKFLEKINGSLPRLVAKIEQDEFKRGSLAHFRTAYGQHTDCCFYCNGILERKDTHVDHFLPWSYIFEDEAWNMVLACQDCNCKKSNSLPQSEFRDLLIDRNRRYRDRISILDRSLSMIDTKIGWRSEIINHYTNCEEYGFNVIKMP